MALQLGDTAPDFTAETTEGTVDFHAWLGDGWGILFSHPKDYTPVCTTELGRVAALKGEFEKRNCKVIGLSVDPLADHHGWAADIEETQGHALNFPLIADPDWGAFSLRVSDRFGDNGIIGAAILRLEGDIGVLDTFLLSCRVIGRRYSPVLGAWLIFGFKCRAAPVSDW